MYHNLIRNAKLCSAPPQVQMVQDGNHLLGELVPSRTASAQKFVLCKMINTLNRIGKVV